MTSNIGSQFIAAESVEERAREQVEEALTQTFPPECRRGRGVGQGRASTLRRRGRVHPRPVHAHRGLFATSRSPLRHGDRPAAAADGVQPRAASWPAVRRGAGEGSRGGAWHRGRWPYRRRSDPRVCPRRGRGLLGGLLGSAAGVAAGAAVTFATTYALGHAVEQYYAQGRRLSTQDLRALFARFQTEANTIYPRVEGRIHQLSTSTNLPRFSPDYGVGRFLDPFVGNRSVQGSRGAFLARTLRRDPSPPRASGDARSLRRAALGDAPRSPATPRCAASAHRRVSGFSLGVPCCRVSARLNTVGVRAHKPPACACSCSAVTPRPALARSACHSHSRYAQKCERGFSERGST